MVNLMEKMKHLIAQARFHSHTDCAITVSELEALIKKAEQPTGEIYAYVDDKGRLVKLRGKTYYEGHFIAPGTPIPPDWRPLYLGKTVKGLI